MYFFPNSSRRSLSAAALKSVPIKCFLMQLLMCATAYSSPFEIKVHDDLIANYEQSAYEFETNLYKANSSQKLKSNVFQTRLEYGYGITPNSELGFNVYLSDYDGVGALNGGKLSHMYIPTHDEEGVWHYGVKNEVNYIKDIDGKEVTFFEFTPIFGANLQNWRMTINPSVDVTLDKNARSTFSPAAKVVYELTHQFDIGTEYYAENLPLKGFYIPTQQPKTVYMVLDIKHEQTTYNIGVGRGVGSGSDNWVIKLLGSLGL